MLLRVDKGIGGGIWHSVYWYTKHNTKYMQGYDKSKESSCIQYRGLNDLYGWAISQNFPVNSFDLIKDTS